MDQWVWALLLHLPLHHRLPCTSEAPSNPCTGNHLARTHNHTCREPCTSFGLIHSLSMITIYFNSHTFLIQLFFFTFFFVESLLSLRRLFLFVSQLTVEIALLHHGAGFWVRKKLFLVSLLCLYPSVGMDLLLHHLLRVILVSEDDHLTHEAVACRPLDLHATSTRAAREGKSSLNISIMLELCR